MMERFSHLIQKSFKSKLSIFCPKGPSPVAIFCSKGPSPKTPKTSGLENFAKIMYNTTDYNNVKG